jgi:hypothetical protein
MRQFAVYKEIPAITLDQAPNRQDIAGGEDLLDHFLETASATAVKTPARTEMQQKPGVVVGGGDVAGTVVSVVVMSVVAGAVVVVATGVASVVGGDVAAVAVTVITGWSVVGVAISGLTVCMTNVTSVEIVFPVIG